MTNINRILNLKVDDKTFEFFIERAIKNQSYIEAISLMHNTIEAYLQYTIIKYLVKNKSMEYYIKRRKTLSGQGRLNSFIVWAEVNHLFDLIDDDMFDKLKSFNAKRNDVIHHLPKGKMTYGEIRLIARLGRELQIKLSPLDHKEIDLKKILYFFDNPNEIDLVNWNYLFGSRKFLNIPIEKD